MARAPGEWPWEPADEDARLCHDLGLPGAGDGNRTRTISLGSHCQCPSITCGDADLLPSGNVPVSARGLP